MTQTTTKTKADEIIALLKSKHAGDVFVPECKDGPSPSARIDAWAMAKSWAHPTTYGYEVKVKRADFLRDEKMTAYLSMCNVMYLVCPWGLIDPKEIPDQFGLLYVTKTGNRLYTKVKAPHRKVDIKESLFRYILMSRAKIGASAFSMIPVQIKDAEYWKEWLAKKDEYKAIGLEVRRKIKEIATGEIFKIQQKNEFLEREINRLKDIKAILRDMGINSADQMWVSRSSLERMGPKGLIPSVRTSIKHLQLFMEKLESYGEDRKK